MVGEPNSDISHSLDRHCHDGVCHCDWRISIYDCQESIAMWYVNAANIAIAALSTAIGLFMLVYRVYVKGHTIWYHANALSGILRPRPVDSMLFCFIFFNLFRILSSAILMADAAPEGWIVRSFFYEFPWSFGLGGVTIYLIGVANSISQSNSAAGWLPSPFVIDIAGIIALSGPVIFGIPLALGAGACAEKGLTKTAATLIRISYMLWFVWVATIAISVLFAGVRLVRILKHHHQRVNRRHNPTDVKSGIYRIQLTVASFVICLSLLAGILLTYCICREKIIDNSAGSIFMGAAWSILGSFTTLIATVAILFRTIFIKLLEHSPSVKTNPALRSNNKSASRSMHDDEQAITETRPDQDFGESTVMAATAVTIQNDNEALLHVIEENERRIQQEQQTLTTSQSSRSKKSWKKYAKPTTRRTSDASSQMELAQYHSH